MARGHAIECRVYAEDPASGFMPSLGEILLLHEPSGPGVRIDSGIRQGDEVSMFYDPMIAKLSCHGASRRAAIDRSVAALKDYAVLGVTTNVEYLIAILKHPAFVAGELHTGFLDEHLPAWSSDVAADGDLALAVAAIAEYEGRGATPGPGRAWVAGPGPEPTPWCHLGRFRLNGLA
jgi:acetyl/propionyl-CoA carboxylase alpha subunit